MGYQLGFGNVNALAAVKMAEGDLPFRHFIEVISPLFCASPLSFSSFVFFFPDLGFSIFFFSQ
jgi:hypothetical protein